MSPSHDKSFSLSTLLLFVVIVALIVSHVVMMRQLANARAEVEDIRRKYGHIQIENAEHTYVARIAENEQDAHAYRIHIPPGRHYLLHLTDTTFPTDSYPADPQPSATLSMNSWRQGADVVLSFSIYRERGAPRVVVHTETEQLFDYVMKDWIDGGGRTEGSQLQASPQQAFSADDTIRFMWWRDPTTQRGIMLWMEPVARWEARRGARAAKKADEAEPAAGPVSNAEASAPAQ